MDSEKRLIELVLGFIKVHGSPWEHDEASRLLSEFREATSGSASRVPQQPAQMAPELDEKQEAVEE